MIYDTIPPPEMARRTPYEAVEGFLWPGTGRLATLPPQSHPNTDKKLRGEQHPQHHRPEAEGAGQGREKIIKHCSKS